MTAIIQHFLNKSKYWKRTSLKYINLLQKKNEYMSWKKEFQFFQLLIYFAHLIPVPFFIFFIIYFTMASLQGAFSCQLLLWSILFHWHLLSQVRSIESMSNLKYWQWTKIFGCAINVFLIAGFSNFPQKNVNNLTEHKMSPDWHFQVQRKINVPLFNSKIWSLRCMFYYIAFL